MDKRQQAMHQARLLLRRQHSGTLSTISVNLKGYPFGSITPFMVNGKGEVIIYASDIAQHSKNMQADARVSICINDATLDDSQASARVTIVGTSLADSVSESDIARYYRLFPKAKAYVKAHDFRFYTIAPTRVRFIGGFGEIFWFEKNEWLDQYLDLSQTEIGAIQHMHEDHADALEAIASSYDKIDVSDSVQMLSIFHDGFHIANKQALYFVPFEQSLRTPDQLRQAMVNITKKAREPLLEI